MGDPGGGISILGVKAAPAVAGFVGAAVSLQYLAKATVGQRMVALGTGTVTAAYIAPALNGWLNLGGQALENGMAFLAGAVAMNLMSGAVELARTWRDDPRGVVAKVVGWLRR